ncbi:hypothetical protein P7C73_g5419, partial [Tremellales sp. Uapishka_1]
MSTTPQTPEILKTTELKADQAKWLKLERIDWKDQEGKERVWEVANRSTRSKAGVDAVHILALLHRPSKPVSTIIIEQYRPPIGKFVVELPAGLIDEGEDAATTAIRELHEETGYGKENSSVEEVSPVLVVDPGMSGANCNIVTVKIELGEDDAEPEQKLEPGEHIVKRVVALKDLYAELQSETDYAKKGFAVDAKLSSIAQGLELSKRYGA